LNDSNATQPGLNLSSRIINDASDVNNVSGGVGKLSAYRMELECLKYKFGNFSRFNDTQLDFRDTATRSIAKQGRRRNVVFRVVELPTEPL
jgi:hypothetical protein